MIRRWFRRFFRKGTVAGGVHCRLIDMDELIRPLEPDTSQFTTMLMQLGRKGTTKPRAGVWRNGHWCEFWTDWNLLAETEYERRTREALEHFDAYWAEVEGPKTNWIEDELMPRVLKIGKTDHPYLREGDIVRVVGKS